MYQLSISLLGNFSARYSGGANPASIKFASTKEQEILGFLVLHRDRWCSRAVLAETLWADSTQERSKKYLRNELWRLRSDIQPPAGCQPPIVTTRDTVYVNEDARVVSDAEALEDARVLIQDGRQLSPEEIRLLEGTTSLYTGPLLSNWDFQWCISDRARLNRIYMQLADRLLTHYFAEESWDKGINLALNVLREDPTCERTHQHLMRLYHGSGDRASALKQYQTCRSILLDELAVEPSQQTQELYERLRREPGRVTEHVTLSEPGDLAAVLDKVNDLSAQVEALKQQLRNATRL